MLLYAITSRGLLPGSEAEKRAGLVGLARAWARGGVDYVQIREKDLPGPELLALAGEIVAAVREEGSVARVLLNGPAEIALGARADGVHLPGSAPAGAGDEAQRVYQRAELQAIVSLACHSVDEVRAAGDASLVVFAPVFEKVDSPKGDAVPGQGLCTLAEACCAAGAVPLVALGGVTRDNAADCVAVGAVGVAGIRLFLGDEWRGLR